MKKNIFFILIFSFLLIATFSKAQSINLSFGDSGIVTTHYSLDKNTYDIADVSKKILVQPDGKII